VSELLVSVTEENIPFFEALASPVRIGIIHYLTKKDANVKELATQLGVSSAIMTSHIKKLEDVGIVTSIRGSQGKLCSLYNNNFALEFPQYSRDSKYNYETSVNVGHYTAVQAEPPCGIADQYQVINKYDDPRSLFDVRRVNAQLLWLSKGFVEYTVPNYVTPPHIIASVEITAELSSEYPHFRDEWPSDIDLILNDELVCTWTSPGDFGARRGRLTPAWWSSNQYGLLKSFLINSTGVFIDEEQMSEKTLKDFHVDRDFLTIRFAVSERERQAGGLTIYGKQFGNHAQDIGVRIGYND
jgi:predicted transcriptional regulator